VQRSSRELQDGHHRQQERHPDDQPGGGSERSPREDAFRGPRPGGDGDAGEEHGGNAQGRQPRLAAQ